jgi:hypothetical protein
MEMHSAPRLDLDSLSFLLETDVSELLFHLMIEQERFETATRAINQRSRLHLEVVQPRLAGAGIVGGVDYSPRQISRALGHALAMRMKRATDDAIEAVDKP